MTNIPTDADRAEALRVWEAKERAMQAYLDFPYKICVDHNGEGPMRCAKSGKVILDVDDTVSDDPNDMIANYTEVRQFLCSELGLPPPNRIDELEEAA